MKGFRLLRPDEIECRVQKCDEKGVSILLYKTARTDADLLDETVGPDKWANDFKVIDGTLYGGIGVDYGKGMIWKWDAGTESNTEAEKGRASDAFKRAGSKHGIGRELYSAPFISVPAYKCKKLEPRNNRWVCYDDFSVKIIDYDKYQRISGLVISSGNDVVWTFGVPSKIEGKPKPQDEYEFFCEDCGLPIADFTDPNGKIVKAAQIVARSKKKFGRCLCISCGTKANNTQTQANSAPVLDEATA